MSEPTRYLSRQDGMLKHKDGTWIRFEEYAELRDESDRRFQALAKLATAVGNPALEIPDDSSIEETLIYFVIDRLKERDQLKSCEVDARRYRLARNHIVPRYLALNLMLPVTDIPDPETIEDRIDALLDAALAKSQPQPLPGGTINGPIVNPDGADAYSTGRNDERNNASSILARPSNSEKLCAKHPELYRGGLDVASQTEGGSSA